MPKAKARKTLDLDKPVPEIPKDAEMYDAGSFYKIGAHGKAYYWDNDMWRLSDKSPTEIKSRINYRIALEHSQGTSRFSPNVRPTREFHTE